MCAKGRIAVVLYGLFWVIKIRKIRVFRYRLSKNNTSNCNFMMAMKTTMTAEGRQHAYRPYREVHRPYYRRDRGIVNDILRIREAAGSSRIIIKPARILRRTRASLMVDVSPSFRFKTDADPSRAGASP